MPRQLNRRRGIAARWLVLVLICAACTSSPTPTPTPTPTPVPVPTPATVVPVEPALSSSNLVAQVQGRTVTASVTLTSTPGLVYDKAGICARNAAQDVVDLPFQMPAQLSPAGTRVSATATLLPGTYTYWACAKYGQRWHDVGRKQTLVIPSPNPSGERMPVGDLPGWRQIFTEDFDTDVPLGGFPGPYSHTWSGYDGFGDTADVGRYAERILSVHDSMLDMYLHTEDGVPLGAAPVPLINDGRWGGQVYGRYVIRFRSDYLPGYGTGWLLWPDSGEWNDGEIDFPEGSLAGNIQGFNHCIGDAKVKCLSADTAVTFQQWHTAVIDWRPEKLSFTLDGTLIGSTTQNIPDVPMRWTLQTATNGPKPDPATAGHLLIDWVAIYALG